MEARIGTNLVYAPVMEFGRRPGRMPPPQALAGWARRHGFPDTALFVLARAIARKGIRGRFYMRRAAQATKNALPGIMRDVAREIEARFRQ